MRNLKRAVWVCATAVLSACGPEAAEVDDVEAHLASLPSALTQGPSLGCTFNIFFVQRPGTLPPVYDVRLNRAASATCAWPQASLLLGSSTTVTPQLSLAANDLGVAVSYSYKNTPSGSSGTFLSLRHVNPETMTFVRNEGISAGMFGSGSVYSGALAILADGTTLEVRGTKSGVISGETGSGSNYVATYADFFTSTTPRTVVAY